MILLEAPSDVAIAHIHQSTHLIESILGDELEDIVPAYHSIALFSNLDATALLSTLASADIRETTVPDEQKIVEIPICYEMGLDLEEVANHANISIKQLIDIHLSGTYRSLFIGFTPGFIYADGLDKRLACPRKANPRTRLPAGSVGIGGSQTGIYSLESPGGWNIIGLTPMQLFDVQHDPPMIVEVGTVFTFKRITKDQFESWGS